MNVYFKTVTSCNLDINLMRIFKEIVVSAKLLSEKSAEKVSESAEKSAENKADGLFKRQKQKGLCTRQFLFKPCFKTRI